MNPIDPILKLLRNEMKRQGTSVPELAQRAGLERSTLRRALAGSSPMTLEEFVAIASTLELDPNRYVQGIQTVEEEAEAQAKEEPEAPLRLAADRETDPQQEALGIDPWGNHPEQLIRVGFAIGCDFLFLTKVDELEGSGVPKQVLQAYANRDLPIRLDAAYHSYNAPRYDPGGISLTLSFDALYECRFPWSAIRQVVFFPEAPDQPEPAPEEEPEPDEKPRPALRLVK